MRRPLLVTAIAIFSIALVSAAVWSSWNASVANKDRPSDAANPDLPSIFKAEKRNMGKEEYLLRRAEGAARRRGIVKGQKFDPKLRPEALKQMETQQAKIRQMPDSLRKDNLLAAWTAIGPAPIPNGQTSPTQPVSGRVTAIAIHPTNPNIVYVGAAQGGVYRTTNGGTSWTPIFDSAQSLAIGALAIDPQVPETLWVGTGEPNFSIDSYFGVGLYRINNASTTATLTGPIGSANFSGRSIAEIIVNPNNSDMIFVASTSGLGGIRPFNGTAFPNRGVYRSSNATSGAPTFTQINTTPFGNLNLSVRDIALDPNDPDNLVASVVANGGGIITSTNATQAVPTFTATLTFTGTSTSDLTGELAAFASVGAGDATFYAGTGFGGGRVYISTDSGATWTQQIDNNFCGGQCFYDIAIAVDPSNVNNVYIGGDPSIVSARSTNGGTSFTDNNAGVHADTHAMEVAPSDPTQVWLGTDGGIYKSIDSGQTWTHQNTAQFSATQFMNMDVHPTDDDFTIGGTQDNGTNWYQPGGTWTRADFGDGGWAVIDQNAANTTNVRMYHTYFNSSTLQGYGTVNNTANASDGMWTFRGCSGGAAGNGITCGASVNFYAPLERGPGTPNTIYYGALTLWRSADEGMNHAAASQAFASPISSIGISPQNDNVRIVGLNDGSLFGTSTGANPLVDLDAGGAVPNVAIAKTIIDPMVATTAYVTLSAFGSPPVWRTNDVNNAPLTNGLIPTWTDISGTAGANPLPQIPTNAILKDPMSNNIYVGNDIGVYVSTDGGANWAPFGTGLPRVAVFDMKLTPNRNIRIATHGRGMYQIPALLPPTAASVSVSGRVLSANGLPIQRAVVIATDQNGERLTVRTNQFGNYRFKDLQVGATYTIGVKSRRYRFDPQVINLEERITDLNFIARR